MIDDFSLLAALIILGIVSSGFGAGCYVAYRIFRSATGYDEQRMFWQQRHCDHVWHVVCKRCGVEQRRVPE